MRVIKSLLLSVLLCSGSAAAAQNVPLDNDFHFGHLDFGQHGNFFLAVSPRNVGGKLGICGASWTDGTTSRTKSLSPEILSRFHFKMAGQKLRVNTTRFARYGTEAEAEAGGARCAVLRQAWQPAMATAPFEMDMVDRPIRY